MISCFLNFILVVVDLENAFILSKANAISKKVCSWSKTLEAYEYRTSSKTLHGSNLLTEENDSNSSTQKQIQTSIKTPKILKFENLYNNKSEARSYDSLNYSLNTLFKIILIALVYNPAMDIKLDRRSRLTSDLSTKKKANGFNGNNYNYDMIILYSANPNIYVTDDSNQI